MSPRRAERGVLHYLLLGINAGIFALVAAIAALVLIIPAATGSVALTVLTGSMEPGLPPGSLVVVKPTDPADVRIGSIITYQWEPGQPTLVTHRVTEVVSNSDGTVTWTTQGDNNDAPDPNPVTQEQLQGVVWYSLPLVGWVSNLIAGDLRPILVPVIGGALLVYAAVLVVQSLRGRKKPEGGEADAGAEPARGRRSRVAQGRRAAGAESVEPVVESVPTNADWFTITAAEPAAVAVPDVEPGSAPARHEAVAGRVPSAGAAPAADAAPSLGSETSAEGPRSRRRREPEPSADPTPPRRREPRGAPAPGPRRSTWIEPEPAEAPVGRRARRAADRAAAEGAGTGLSSFVDPVPYPEPEPEAAPGPQAAPSPVEPAQNASGPVRNPLEQNSPESPSATADEPPRRPRGKGRSYR
ncbi:MAG: signal peptidase I [Microbacteriaceae bacterium]